MAMYVLLLQEYIDITDDEGTCRLGGIFWHGKQKNSQKATKARTDAVSEAVSVRAFLVIFCVVSGANRQPSGTYGFLSLKDDGHIFLG